MELPEIENIPAPGQGPLWVFAYGSLMWNPGFEFDRHTQAVIHGYHRRLCIWSWRYRGTPNRPGLVLGLDHGGSCVGQAFRVADGAQQKALAYLEEREMITGVYTPCYRKIRLANRRTIRALTFVARKNHKQYAGRLSLDQTLQTISNAAGSKGHNRDYILSTVQHLRELGLEDAFLTRVEQKIVR